MPDTSLVYGLVVLAIALYVSLVVGYIMSRRIPVFHASNLREAFEFLEIRLKRAFPDLRDGFTWSEAMARIRPIYGDVDWIVIEGVLKQYQAYRYGSIDPGIVQTDAIVKLAVMLPRRE